MGTGVLCGLSLVAALVAGEWMVRYLAPQKLYRFPRGMFENHPALHYRLASNFVGVSKTVEFKTRIRTNALGLRADREYGPKGPKTFRILFLGDSFTMGVGVEHDETYGQMLAQRLMERVRSSSHTYEVINAGVPGYNTQQALTYLRELGLALEPDLVVLGFYIGNDIAENFSMPLVSVQEGYLQSGAPTEGVLPAPLRRYLALNSHLYQLLWPYQRRLVDRSLWVRKERERLQRRLAIYKPEPPEAKDRSTGALWEATQQQMAALAEITRSQEVPLAVVIIPEMVQVDPQRWQRMIQPMASSGAIYQADWPNQHVESICHEHHLPVLDLLPVFTQAEADEPLYLPLDGHWTQRGHAVAAATIHAFLRRKQLLPVSESLANR